MQKIKKKFLVMIYLMSRPPLNFQKRCYVHVKVDLVFFLFKRVLNLLSRHLNQSEFIWGKPAPTFRLRMWLSVLVYSINLTPILLNLKKNNEWIIFLCSLNGKVRKVNGICRKRITNEKRCIFKYFSLYIVRLSALVSDPFA